MVIKKAAPPLPTPSFMETILMKSYLPFQGSTHSKLEFHVKIRRLFSINDWAEASVKSIDHQLLFEPGGLKLKADIRQAMACVSNRTKICTNFSEGSVHCTVKSQISSSCSKASY